MDAIIISQEAGIRHKVSFLIDTGASMTILLDKDVKDIGLDLEYDPEMVFAHKSLGLIYHKYLNQPDRTIYHMQILAEVV